MKLAGAANTFIASNDLFNLFLLFVKRCERQTNSYRSFRSSRCNVFMSHALCTKCNFTCYTNQTPNSRREKKIRANLTTKTRAKVTHSIRGLMINILNLIICKQFHQFGSLFYLFVSFVAFSWHFFFCFSLFLSFIIIYLFIIFIHD